jgi:uncharacterized protein YacL
MLIFKDISNFKNTSDYLPILAAAINVDLIFIFLLYHGYINSPILEEWYNTFRLSAVIADVLILVIGVIITRFLYSFLFSSFSIINFTILAVIIQITHDILFYLLFSRIPKGHNYMIEFFKKYSKQVGYKAIIGDTAMIILTCLLSSRFATFNTNANIINLILTSYFIPYMIYYRK